MGCPRQFAAHQQEAAQIVSVDKYSAGTLVALPPSSTNFIAAIYLNEKDENKLEPIESLNESNSFI